jgi:hypothetical protein
MLKWEYLVVEFFPDIYNSGFDGIKSGPKHKVIENGRIEVILKAEFNQVQVREHGAMDEKMRYPELPEFVDYLNRLGSDGWEMVAKDADDRKYYFKRRVEEAG